MGKKSKSSKKRQERRERAKLRAEGKLPEEQIESQEAEAEEAVQKAAKAEPEKKPEKKASRQARDEHEESAWDRLKRFFGDVKIEALKINWPSTDETWKSTWVTVFVIVVLSVFMGFCSAGFQVVSETLFGVETQLTNPVNVNPTDALQEGVGGEATGDTGGTTDTGGTDGN